jgi:hypothetical protein
LFAVEPGHRGSGDLNVYAPALAGSKTDVPTGALPLSEVASRVNQLLREVGDDLTTEAAYEVVYRSLSTFVTHATLPLLDSYLPRKGGYYIRIARQPNNSGTMTIPRPRRAPQRVVRHGPGRPP